MTQPMNLMNELLAGNRRFVSEETTHPRSRQTDLAELQARHQPRVAILTCSDSRVDPAIIFDAGLGDLFVVRSAGAVAGANGIGSLEYAVDTLLVELILVLGHSNCGAVSAALRGDSFPGDLGNLIGVIRRNLPADVDSLQAAIETTVSCEVTSIQERSPIIASGMTRGMWIIGSILDLSTGRIQVLGGWKGGLSRIEKGEDD